MVAIDDLTGVPEDKRKQIIKCLDSLLTFRDSQDRLSPVISGYNAYAQLAKFSSVIAVSHTHETEAYKASMLRDLAAIGYNAKDVLQCIREKSGVFRYKKGFRTVSDRGSLLPGLRIKNTCIGQYLSPAEMSGLCFKDINHYLVCESIGWELNLPFNGKDDLFSLVDLFLKKSGLFIYDAQGIELPETQAEQFIRSPWIDAYETPILVIGASALQYYDALPHFDQAIKISLIENSNEISFIIHKNLEILRNLQYYKQLRNLGFCEEMCLANKPFLKYINNIT